ncbi:MAG: hypothetical protein EBR64_00330 [Burkholderiaceae bacterium]|nr:hypothetical protein [Burkholderiaceae bacterium]
MNDQDLLIPASQVDRQAVDARTRRGRIQMILLLLACAAPVIASYLAYYVFKPEGGKTNYGTLIQPPQAINPSWLDISFSGKWTLLVARPASECRKGNDACVELLYLMRQVRLALGKGKNRVQLVWVVSDRLPVDPDIKQAYDPETAGFIIVPAPDPKNGAAWLTWLNQQNLGRGIQLIDPSGEKMMVFPDKAESKDFVRMRKDLDRLLKLNRKGEKI